MSNQTLFYICGIALAVSAVLFSFAGLRLKGFPGRAFPLVVLWFVLLIGGATTLAVRNAQDEQHKKEAEFQKAAEELVEKNGLPTEIESAAGEGPEAGGGESGGQSETGAEGEAGAGTVLKLAAEPNAIAFDKTHLTAKPGKVTIDFKNPAPIEHDVAIEKGPQEIAASELITESETSVSAELKPGTYTYLCTVPGHAEAGMKGTLTVK
ncbi:MAG TPA: plastocyanin/azurin family copper-binding protein [Solirubrobacterales bacterium]|jgi:plastocyanin